MNNNKVEAALHNGVFETQESADAWTAWAREHGVHLTHPFMRRAFIAGYLEAKRKHAPLDPPHVEVLKDHNRFKGGLGCGPHCGEEMVGVTIHCRHECCHEKPGAYDSIGQGASVADRRP